MDGSGSPPALFLAHGAPTLALDGGAWAERLARLGGDLPSIRAVLVCSAHWETSGGFAVGSGDRPRTIHDFGGFPEPLYRLQYPAPGEPELARQVAGLLAGAGFVVDLEVERGLDHGAWVPLMHLLPQALVPVVPLSLPRLRDPGMLRAAGRALAPLRREGVLILGSGGLVHNLGRLDWEGSGAPPVWAEAFEGWILDGLGQDREGVLSWTRAPGEDLAVPTSEHLDPLWLILGVAEGLPARSLFEGWQFGSLSLRCLMFGGAPGG